MMAAACTISLSPPESPEGKLTSVAEELVEDHHLPGITIAVANADGLTTISAGLPDHVHMPAFYDLWLAGTADAMPEDLIELVLDTEPLFTAGDGWSCTDTGYLLIGLMIAKHTEQSYADEVRARFLTPLGLTMTGPSNQKRLPGLARGYAFPACNTILNSIWPSQHSNSGWE